MKRMILVFLTLLILVCVSCSANQKETDFSGLNDPASDYSETAFKEIESTDYPIAVSFGPIAFASLEEMAAFIRQNGYSVADHYYIPTVLSASGTAPRSIQMRPVTYITNIYDYKLEALRHSEIREGSYEEERLGSLVCQTYLFTDPAVALENFIPNFPGCKPMEYNGRTIYYFAEYSPNDTSLLIGHEVILIQDDRMVYLHLSGQDSLEEMLRYTELTRVEVP